MNLVTENKKNASINYILDQGLVKPPTLWQCITKMHRVLGWRFIFWDINYSIIFASVSLLAMTFLFFYAPSDLRYSAAFGFSPVMFLLIILVSEMNERACRLYTVKQTCRYTSRQISALRCIYYSIAGVAFATIIVAVSTENIAQFLRLLPLCLGGLFLCAAIELSVLRLSHSKWSIAVFTLGWMIINAILPIMFFEHWERFLSGLPLVFTITFALAGAAMFMYQTTKMLTEEKQYAIA